MDPIRRASYAEVAEAPASTHEEPTVAAGSSSVILEEDSDSIIIGGSTERSPLAQSPLHLSWSQFPPLGTIGSQARASASNLCSRVSAWYECLQCRFNRREIRKCLNRPTAKYVALVVAIFMVIAVAVFIFRAVRA